MAQEFELHLNDSISFGGPHGAYASVFLSAVGKDRCTLKLDTYKTQASKGSPPGPLSMEACNALVNAVIHARALLDKNRDAFPKGMSVLAELTRAEQVAAREIHQPKPKERTEF